MTSKEFEFKKQILISVDTELIRPRFDYILRLLKNQRDDIETLFKYVKYATIYAITLNVIIMGILVCLIIAN